MMDGFSYWFDSVMEVFNEGSVSKAFLLFFFFGLKRKNHFLVKQMEFKLGSHLVSAQENFHNFKFGTCCFLPWNMKKIHIFSVFL